MFVSVLTLSFTVEVEIYSVLACDKSAGPHTGSSVEGCLRIRERHVPGMITNKIADSGKCMYHLNELWNVLPTPFLHSHIHCYPFTLGDTGVWEIQVRTSVILVSFKIGNEDSVQKDGWVVVAWGWTKTRRFIHVHQHCDGRGERHSDMIPLRMSCLTFE
jgi:hypothetical protein